MDVAVNNLIAGFCIIQRRWYKDCKQVACAAVQKTFM